MFCTKCGTELKDNTSFCYNCKNQIKSTEESPFAKDLNPETHLNKRKHNTRTRLQIYGWVLALYPFVSWLISYGISIGLALFLPENLIISCIVTVDLITYVSLLSFDSMFLKSCGYSGNWRLWRIYFLPAYLFIRCKKTNINYGSFICSLLICLLPLLICLLMIIAN